MLWIITGACKGVGKTSLCLELCKVLGNSAYAKQGHGVYKKTKARNYFRNLDELEDFIRRNKKSHDHVVVESNELAKKGRGDIVIFLGKSSGGNRPREDAEELKKKAHIIIDGEHSKSDLSRALGNRLGNGKTREAVEKLLQRVLERYKKPRMVPAVKLWFECEGRSAFGPGLYRLLKAIDETGSISSSSKAEGISYKHAWETIREAEGKLKTRLVAASPGGRKGGGTWLTEECKVLLEIYGRLEREIRGYAALRFERALENLKRRKKGDPFR